LESLRAGADPGEFHGAAHRTLARLRLGVPAVEAAEHPLAVEDEGDVAGRAAQGRATGTAVQRRRHSPPVQEQDRLATALCERSERLEQRRREWVPRFAAQVDDPYRRQPRAEALAKL